MSGGGYAALFLVRAQRGVRHPPAGTPPGVQLGHHVLEGSQVLTDPGDRLFAWSGTEFTEWEVDGRRRYRLPGPPAG